MYFSRKVMHGGGAIVMKALKSYSELTSMAVKKLLYLQTGNLLR